MEFNSGETVVKGANFFQVNRKQDGTRASSSVSYIHPILERENFTLLTDTWVREILFEDERAVGVSVVNNAFGKAHTITAGREVILSAGAIDSPKLLMLSGIGPAEHLAEHGITARVDSPGVGQHLQDHPEVVIGWDARSR